MRLTLIGVWAIGMAAAAIICYVVLRPSFTETQTEFDGTPQRQAISDQSASPKTTASIQTIDEEGVVAPSQLSDPFSGSSSDVKSFFDSDWEDTGTFSKGLLLLQNAGTTSNQKNQALSKFAANLHRLTVDEIQQLLDALRDLLRDPATDAAVLRQAVHTFAAAALLQKERGQWSGERARQDGALLMAIAANDAAPPEGRHAALKALGALDVRDATPMIRGLLDDKEGRVPPEALAGACLALARLEPDQAAPAIGEMIRTTQSQTVFDAGVYALGEINTPQAMVAVVESMDRYLDSPAGAASLSKMADTILGVLAQPQSAALPQAIDATEHLWREEQRAAYAPLLGQIVVTAPVEEAQHALDRLLDMASRLDSEREKEALEPVLQAAETRPELDEYADRIRDRLSATVLKPNDGDDIPAPASSVFGGR